jgi:rare lipoprotein A (peptidoglycan hydrolase)
MQQMNATQILDPLRARASWQHPRRAVALPAAAMALAGLLAASPTGRGPQFPDTLPDWMQQGRISWYGPGFHGRRTANGEVFDSHDLTMAHRTLPLGTIVRVTSLENGRSVVLRVNDRGPYVRGRVADLSQGAAQRLDFLDDGVVTARIELL